jgi:nucleoside phosphorylase
MKSVYVQSALGFELDFARRGLSDGASITFHFGKSGLGERRAYERIAKKKFAPRPSLILDFGIAGALDPSLSLGQAMLFSAVYDLQTQQSLDNTLHEEVLRLAPECGFVTGRMLAATGKAVLERSARNRLYFQTNCRAVCWESYGVAKAAAELNIPFLGVRVISDTDEPKAAADQLITVLKQQSSLGLEAAASALSAVVNRLRL